MTLKRIRNLGFILFLSLFASCGGDSSSDALVGTWTAQTLNDTDITLLDMTRTLDGTNFTDTILIGCTETVGTYETSGSDIIFTVASTTGWPCVAVGDSWINTYSVDGDTATFSGSGNTWVYTK